MGAETKLIHFDVLILMRGVNFDVFKF